MTLAAIQQRFHATITKSDGQSALDWPLEMRNGLEIYRTAYRSRLVSCLREAFGKTRKWIGDESFDAASAHHLILHPPSSWTLDAVGAGFDATLAELFPDDPEVEELAWLEWEMQEVFVAADDPVVTAADFADGTASYGDDDWLNLRLSFVPGIRIRAVASDCAALWTAIDQEADMPPLDVPDGKSSVLVWRKDLKSQFRLLGEDEAAGLQLMRGGGTFEALCTMLVDRAGDDAGVQVAGTMLGQWIMDGLVSDAGPEVRSRDA